MIIMYGDYRDENLRKLMTASERFQTSKEGMYVTDADREKVITLLREAYAQGCISEDMFDQRMAGVTRVPLTRSALDRALVGLPVDQLKRVPAPVPAREPSLLWLTLGIMIRWGLLIALLTLILIYFVEGHTLP